MAQIDIQGLFKDVLPNEAIEDKAEGLRQAELVGTLGGMAAYYAPQRERQLRRAAGGLFGVDLRSEAEKARDDLKAMGTPKTMQEHQRYADILDRVQAGSGVQYMMGIAQEKRAERSIEVDEGNLAARREELTEQQRLNNERIRIDSMNLVRNLDADKKPDIRQTGDQVIAITTGPDGKPVVETVYDGSSNLNAAKVASLTTAASLKYKDNPEGFSAIVSNILSGNIKDASDFDDYVTIPEEIERGGFVGTMRTADIENAAASNSALSGIYRAEGALDSLQQLGVLNPDGSVNSDLRTGGGLVTRTIESIYNEIPNGRDELSYLRTEFSKDKNAQIINALPPGIASDRDISLFAAGFPADDASVDELARYFKQAEFAYKMAADYARLKSTIWDQQMTRGENANMVGISSAWQRYYMATKSGVINDIINEASDDDLEVVLQGIKEEYGVVPFEYQTLVRQ
jgi:hypothetical protein